MRATIEKIFRDKAMERLDLDYRGRRQNEGIRERSGVTKKNRLIGSLVREGASVLDIGCGEGALLSHLMEEKRLREAVGIDISVKSVEIARGRGVDARCMDVLQMELPDEWVFDYIILADFIEHIADPERLMVMLRDHYRTAVIISLPNIGYITSRLRLLIGGRFPIQWARHPGEHVRFWTVRDFIWWASQLGFGVERIIPVRGAFLKYLWPGLFSAKNIFLLGRLPGRQ